ncbi:MAG TPA: superoxide dismutase [Acidimicrobiia bacterium]|nr:superoxide dismutase [Acidimicrobiia bacterium]
MRRFFVTALTLVAVLASIAPAAAAPPQSPDIIDLPDGFFPEGIVIDDQRQVYASSLADGAIWKGELRTGIGDVLVPGTPGRLAVGMSLDERTGHLFVAGGPDGNAYVYDSQTGGNVGVLSLTPFGFVNDVIVTHDAAYFTDSFAPQIYVVPLSPGGAISGAPGVIPLSGDFQFEPGQFNANGIEAAEVGNQLVIVNSFFGEVYTVDPATGAASLIDLGGAVVNGDGLVLLSRTLYAVEGGKNQITEIALAPDLSSGVVVDALISPAFDVPTTAAKIGDSLYAVNAKFATPPLPTTPYEIVRVTR